MSNKYFYLQENVREAAEKRISYIFDEFDDIFVSYSGGKDSTVILGLALKEAEKRNRLPLKVFWIDQELEWDTTAELVEELKKDKRLKFYHIQVEIDYTNNTSNINGMFKIWDEKEKDKWIRQKSPDAIKENIFGVTRFYELFPEILKKFGNGKTCSLGGVRVEESPSRKVGLTSGVTYKYITWGTTNGEKGDNYITLYPIYDWTARDVWKYIFEENLPYNKLYDYQFRHGIHFKDMRCSSLIHETAIRNLVYVPDVSHSLIDRLEKRLPSISTIKHNKKSFLQIPKDYPFMFTSWLEYTEYLIENILFDEVKEKYLYYLNKAKSNEYFINIKELQEKVCKLILKGVLRNDQDLVYLNQGLSLLNKFKNKNFDNDKQREWYNKYLLTKK